MIKNDKGFALTEILILSAVVIGVLTFMYIQFKTINRSYQKSFKYDTPEGLYLANNILNYINDDNFDILVEKLALAQEGYIDITDCDINIYSTSSFCEKLYEKEGVEQIIFTSENPSRIVTNNNLDSDMKEFIKQIKTINTETDHRIIIKYTNGTFATMRFNKGNSYVQNGLITYLDGINNTGEGHSNNTDIWKDLSGNNNDATLYNSPEWSNNSLTFDGIDDYGVLTNTANLEFPDGLTLETRVKIISTDNGSDRIYIMFLDNASSGNPANGLSFCFGKERPKQIYSRIKVNNSNASYIIPKASNDNEINRYYTITLTHNNNNVNLYIDGTLIETLNANGEYTKSSNPIYLSLQYLGNIYSNVEFQNLLIYDRALSESEVQRNYQADLARY